jgi:hypothetical protein
MEHKTFGGGQKVAGFFAKGGSIGLAFLGGPLPPRKHRPVFVGVQPGMGLVPYPYLFGMLTCKKNTADAGGFYQGWFAGGRGGKRFYRVAQCEGGDKGYGEQWFLLHGRLFQFAGCFICGSSYIRKGSRGFVLLVD